MTEVIDNPQTDPIAEMRNLIYDAYTNGLTDVPALQRFINLYEAYIPPGNGQELDDFLESLDSPDKGFEFWQGMFDDAVGAYLERGGLPEKLSFPEINRNPEDDWGDQVSDLIATFENPDSIFLQTHAAYVARHVMAMLKGVDDFQGISKLVANPRFLSAFVDAMQRQAAVEDEVESLPTTAEYAVLAQVTLQALGYANAVTMIEDWSHEETLDGVTKLYTNVEANMKVIAELQATHPGAVGLLNQRFGIRHFRRYPTEMLINQVVSLGKASRPYGLILGGVSDHNGALGQKQDIIKGLAASTADSHDLFVAEANSAQEFEYRLKQFHALNHTSHKIDFAIVSAHGGAELVQFGLHPALGSLAITTEFETPEGLFAPNATIVVTGCETGRGNGIASRLSRLLNVMVLAPTEEASTHAITAVNDKNGLRLIPTFQSKEEFIKPAIYKSGERLDDKEAANYLALL